MRVVSGVDVQHRNGPRRPTGLHRLGARHRGHRRKQVGGLASQAVGHHAAVGHAGSENRVPVYRQMLANIRNHCPHEAHIIDAPITRLRPQASDSAPCHSTIAAIGSM